jgi:hypothetical protein
MTSASSGDSVPAAVHPDATLVRSERALVTAVDDELVMLDPDTDRYFSLAGTGALIWSLLEQPSSVNRVVDSLLDEYQIDRSTCAEAVQAFVAEMVAADLIAVTDLIGADGAETGP